ncbi:CNNM domain-containing protein [Caldalkalibacillus uzonensis]|uniref:CNNM domain-containing protein n=1 Tax=Caldalkalibacillus uzonensis TaxID=353224 RepID=UPI0027D7A25A|nr:CNNM domain-containing protein [Caldalkalibacillus uzonensis]
MRLKHFADEKRKGAQKTLYISEHFDKALTTILVGNNLVNIAAATLASSLFCCHVWDNLYLFCRLLLG